MAGLVNCAIDNSIFGPNTAQRFTDFSNFYLFYVFGSFLYWTLIDYWVYVVLWALSLIPFTFGAANYLMVPYWIITHLGPVFLNLYWANAIYEAFHPVVAPEIVAGTS